MSLDYEFAPVDVNLPKHPRILEIDRKLRRAALGLYVAGLCYAREQRTAGRLPRSFAEDDEPRVVAELVRVGLWNIRDDDGAYDVHNFERKAGAVTTSADRTRRYREKRRHTTSDAASPPASHVTRHGDVTASSSSSISSDPVTDDRPPAGDHPCPPAGNMFAIGPEGTPLAGMLIPMKPPEWFCDVVDTVRANTGETVDPRLAWSRYSAHRAKSGKPMGPMDAQYFVTTVDVVEAKRERQFARERIERRDEDEHRQAARARRGMSPAARLAPAKRAIADDDAHVHLFTALTRERELAQALGA